MLWTLRSLPRACRSPRRPFSFTAHPRFPRTTSHSTPPVPVFRKELTKTQPLPAFADAVREASHIRNQVLFTIAGSVTALVIGAQLTNLEMAEWLIKLRNKPLEVLLQSENVSSDSIAAQKYRAFGKVLIAGLAKLKADIEGFPKSVKALISYGYVQLFQPILNASEGKRMAWTIGAVNVAVFLAWRVPRWNALMRRAFVHVPLSGKSYTMLTSTFSHESFLHLAANCFVLGSFGASAAYYLWEQAKANQTKGGITLPEVSSKWHLLSLFISAGLFSSLVSHVGHTRFAFARVFKSLKTAASETTSTSTSAFSSLRSRLAGRRGAESARAAAGSDVIPGSLGASGAIYALVTMTALAYPNSEIYLLLLPMMPFTMSTGVCGMVALDVIGVLRGWRFLDHYAHLGGAAFGAFWWWIGPDFWHWLRVKELPLTIAITKLWSQ
ncbi:uncharacterized protein BXZ73DRAFT_51640 [Epithele typhae]|uniref:uncharacterized protein n=1 Tax=Epithele typhae TaxID=378194 RepID=UPI002007B717|nr:uncharacterized protein BXZ73DRAFT_51640 [Epithele typhae]KAH9921686.1 hypothetical protein BXZ73DRAFT_51640 [Epithele typhae]